jgi:hypothetical protein
LPKHDHVVDTFPEVAGIIRILGRLRLAQFCEALFAELMYPWKVVDASTTPISWEPAQPIDHIIEALTAVHCRVAQHELISNRWRKLHTRKPIAASSSWPLLLDDDPARFGRLTLQHFA